MRVLRRCGALFIVLFLVIGRMGGSRSLSCLSDWGAAKNGGNCTFDVSLCGWISDYSKVWEWTAKESVAVMKKISVLGNKASMTSPQLCETSSGPVCLRMRYKMNSSRSRGSGRKLSIERCTTSCVTLWSTTKVTANQWQAINVSVETSGPFTIRITGETSFFPGDPQIYLDDVTYTNTPCNQTRNTRSLNGTTTIDISTDRSTLSGPVTSITSTSQGPTQETALGVESSHEVVDTAVSTGTAAAVVAIAMVIAAVVVVARYYISKGCCNRSLLQKKRSIRKQAEKNPPNTAFNQLYNMIGFNRNSSCRSQEINSIRHLPEDEPEVNIYSDIEYIDTTFPRRNQVSVMDSARSYWVSERVQTSSLVAMASSIQSEATGETIYQNEDTKEHLAKEFGQDSSDLTPCAAEMKRERVYQNVDTSL